MTILNILQEIKNLSKDFENNHPDLMKVAALTLIVHRLTNIESVLCKINSKIEQFMPGGD